VFSSFTKTAIQQRKEIAMKTSVVRRNVVLYKLFVMFNEPLFWGPILVISLQSLAHMSLPDIYFMESAVMITCVALDIPAGALADVIGRKKTLIIGRLFLLGSIIGFATMSSPVGAWVSNIIWSIGYAFQSGADHAFLGNVLKEARIGKSFMKVDGRATGSKYLLIAACSLAVGPLAEIDLRLPLFLSIPFVIIPLISSFFLKEQRVANGYSVKQQFKVLKKGVLFAIRKPEVRWVIGFCALVMGASKIWFFTYNPYFEKVGISLGYFGVIFSLLNIVAWFFSHYAHRIEKYFKERSCVMVMIMSVGVPIFLMGVFPCWPMALLIIVQNVVRGFMRPFVANFMNRHIESEDIRATAFSVRSTLTEVVSILSLAWFGFMDKSLGLITSLVVLGVIVLVLGSFSYARYRSLFSETLVRK
jgi:MFS family permease